MKQGGEVSMKKIIFRPNKIHYGEVGEGEGPPELKHVSIFFAPSPKGNYTQTSSLDPFGCSDFSQFKGGIGWEQV